jgi:hypothetical protein
MKVQRIVGMMMTLGVALATTAPSSAYDLGDIAIHGFVTQTVLKSSDHSVFALDSSGGSLDWFEIAINFSSEPVDGLRIGMQLLAREFGPSGNDAVVIDWATGDYRFHDWLGVRIGKNKLPFGLYNESRDADMARPSILLPQSMYPETMRDLLNAYLGGEVYGFVPLGSKTDLDYRVFYGTMNLDNVLVVRRNVSRGAWMGLQSLPMPLSNATYSVDNIEASMDHIYGGALVWNAPINGLRVSATWHTSQSNFSSNTTYRGWMGPAPMSLTLQSTTDYKTENSWVASAEYRTGKLLLVGEYWESTIRMQNSIGGLPFPSPQMPTIRSTNIGQYTQAAYRFAPWCQLSGYYSVYYTDKDDKDGRILEMRGQPRHRAWSKDLALTVRFDINTHWLIKIEAHVLDGTGGALVEPMDQPDGRLERDWTMFLARATFHF